MAIFSSCIFSQGQLREVKPILQLRQILPCKSEITFPRYESYLTLLKFFNFKSNVPNFFSFFYFFSSVRILSLENLSLYQSNFPSKAHPRQQHCVITTATVTKSLPQWPPMKPPSSPQVATTANHTLSPQSPGNNNTISANNKPSTTKLQQTRQIITIVCCDIQIRISST